MRCKKCKEVKDEAEFRKYSRGPRKGQRYEYCNTCYAAYAQKARDKREFESQKRKHAEQDTAHCRLKSMISDAMPKKPVKPKLAPEIQPLKRVFKKLT